MPIEKTELPLTVLGHREVQWRDSETRVEVRLDQGHRITRDAGAPIVWDAPLLTWNIAGGGRLIAAYQLRAMLDEAIQQAHEWNAVTGSPHPHNER